jgi:RNA polymerase sigma-70 factor (ECF subfamily)
MSGIPKSSNGSSGDKPPPALVAPPKPDDEAEWMKQVAAGDERAITNLLEQFQPGIRLLVGRLTAWSPDVDDLTQEVFLKAWQKAAQFNRQISLQNWLYTIAVNQCRNHRRSLLRWWKLLDGFFEHTRFAQTSTAAVHQEQSEAWIELQQALLQLKATDRELLVLTYMEEKSTAEITQILAISENSYYVRLHRAKERLAQQWNKARTEMKS